MIRAKKPVEGTDHKCIEEKLSAYLDGELLPQELDAVEHHLATCQDCQWDLETLRQVVQWTTELPVLAVPRVCTIPVAVQPERAPRRRSFFLPALQGATALVALLLFFAAAGDFLVGGLRQASAPQQVMEMDTVAMEATMAPAEAPVSEAVVTQVVQAIVEVTKVVEVEEARKESVQPPPPSAPQATPVAAPTEAAETMVFPATPGESVTEATGMGGAPETSAAATAQPQLEAPLAAAPATTEAMADMTLAATVLTPTVPVTPAWPATTALAVPTVVAEAGQPVAPAPAEGEQPSARALRESGPNWWHMAEYALGGLFVMLVIVTLVATVRSRKTR